MIEKIKTYLKNPEFVNLCHEYDEQKTGNVDITFNIFSLISDKYHRENFHSDIIAAFLDRSANHNENNKFLNEFLKLINRIKKDRVKITDFQNALITREKGGRIDILIRDDVSKKAIIIENKIKNAPDTYRQLPKYLENTKGRGYDVVAIVYLPLDTNKVPNQHDWSKNESSEINDKLVIIPTFNGSEKDFLNGWIKRCELVARNIDALSVIKQYSSLISNISTNIMDNNLMEKFYKLTSENYETVIGTKKMLNQLPQYLATRIKHHYEVAPKPFQKTWIYENTVAVIDDYRYGADNHCLTIDITCSEEIYILEFFDRQYDNNTNLVETILKDLGLLNEMSWNGRRFVKKFAFIKGEEQLFAFIDNLTDNLKKI